MIIHDDIIDELTIYIKIQNIQLLKFISLCENWNFKDLCEEYL